MDKSSEDVSSCIINIPKQRVFVKSSKDLIKVYPNRKTYIGKLDKRFSKPSEVSLQKFSLPGAKPLRVKNCGKDELVLSFRQYVRQQHAVKHKNSVAIKVREQHKFISTDLKNRLHVEQPPDDVIAVTDTDKNFFNFINGRPLRLPCGSHYKSIMHLFNYRLMKKIEVGYREDTIMNIDANYKNEQKEYDMSVRRCMNQVKCFDQFISEDYQKSMECLENWEELKREVQIKNVELESLASRIFTISSRLIGLDYMYNQQQKYGRFLYYLSSPTWRAQNREFAHSVEIEAKGFDLGGYSEVDTFTVLFEKMQRECAGNFVKPALYFTQPADLYGVLETIEQQQQYHFDHVVRMAPLAKLMKTGIAQLKESIIQDTAAVASTIEGYEAQVKFYYVRSKQLEEKFYKILNGLFYQSVGTIDVLKFTLHLEFCYEKVCNEKPINMDIVAMAKTLEGFYMDYILRLELLHGDDVKKAITESVREEKLKTKKSHEAARELRLFERLERELLIAFAPVAKPGDARFVPPVARQSAASKIKSQSRRAPCKQNDLKKKSLNESELEYLHLFTDWTENEDPSQYLHKS